MGDLLLWLVRILLLLSGLFGWRWFSLLGSAGLRRVATEWIRWWTFKSVLQRERKKDRKELKQTIKNCRKGSRFQFEGTTAAKLSINHNQRNKFSLVSLHVCSINFFSSIFMQRNFSFLRSQPSRDGGWWKPNRRTRKKRVKMLRSWSFINYSALKADKLDVSAMELIQMADPNIDHKSTR